jgi:hypothetical protein
MNSQATESAGAEYQPQGQIRDYFLGAWKLVSTEQKYPDGRRRPFPDLGPDAVGFLLYTPLSKGSATASPASPSRSVRAISALTPRSPSGCMCAQIMKPGRSQGDEASTPSRDGFISYCGTFELKEHEQTMIHRPETASLPNWVGRIQPRRYHLVGPDRFFFRGTEQEKQEDGTVVPVVWTITWERLK